MENRSLNTPGSLPHSLHLVRFGNATCPGVNETQCRSGRTCHALESEEGGYGGGRGSPGKWGHQGGEAWGLQVLLLPCGVAGFRGRSRKGWRRASCAKPRVGQAALALVPESTTVIKTDFTELHSQLTLGRQRPHAWNQIEKGSLYRTNFAIFPF